MRRVGTESARRMLRALALGATVGTLGATVGVFGVFGGLVAPSLASAAPAMPDPRQMSGIPRPDPAVPPDQLTVRCLLGGFSEPAVGVEVTVVAADRGPALTLKAMTDAAGRATISGLSAAVGRTVKASAVLGGDLVETLPISIRADLGSRVLLVKGALAARLSGPPAPTAPIHGGSAGSADVDFREGIPFALPEEGAGSREAGTLVVGIIDLASSGVIPQAGKKIAIEITGPGEEPGEPMRRETVTDAAGRAFFSQLAAPNIAEGSTFVVVASVVDGEPPRRSESFTMGATPMAVVFTPSRRLDSPGAAPPTPTTAVAAQPPRPDGSLLPGVLIGQAIDATGAPVAGLSVTAERGDMTGQRTRWTAQTNAAGEARFEGLPTGSDGIYTLTVERDGAPFRSSFFELIDAVGVRAQVRTFPVSNDRNILKSALQIEVKPLENNESQVIQIYEVFVEGEFAYWSENEMRIGGSEGAHGLQIMPQAKRWLEEREGAQFATLSRPIEPGEVVQLSTAYLLPHDGEAEYQWTAPFPIVQATAVLAPEFSVSEGAKGPGRAPNHEQGGPPAAVKLYEIAIGEWDEGACSSGGEGCTAETWPETGARVELSVSNLPTRAQWSRQLGVALIVAFGGLIGGSALLRRRVSAADALEARRVALLARIASLDSEDPVAGGASARKEALVAALDEVCRKLDSLRDGGHNRGA